MSEAWVKIPNQEEWAKIREALSPGAKHPYDFGYFPAMGRLHAAHPRIGMAFGALFSQIMFEPGALDRREREMVAAVTAAAQDCCY
jgi:alkylhydroperoxidase/carboxymuconolactone decarboxylase family protein YurZ